MSNENPYDKITFDPSSYRKAQREVSDSFSQSISDAGTTAGMAAGMTGRSAGRVVANVAGRAYSARDEAASRITAQEAAAKTQFEQWKAVKKAEFESQKPGIFDILGTVLETGAAVATTALTAGAAAPILAPILTTKGAFDLGTKMSSSDVKIKAPDLKFKPEILGEEQEPLFDVKSNPFKKSKKQTAFKTW